VKDFTIPQMMPPLKPEDMTALEHPQIIPAQSTATEVDTAINPLELKPDGSSVPFISEAPTAQEAADNIRAKDAELQDYSWGQFASDVVSTDWATSKWLFGEEAPAPDPTWELTPQHQDRWKKEVPEHLQPLLPELEVMSEGQFDKAIRDMKSRSEAEGRLANLTGWGQTGRIALGAVDPTEIVTSIVADVASAGTLTPVIAAKWGLKAKTAMKLTAGVSNAATGLVFSAARDTDDEMSWADYGLGIGIDYTVGHLLGGLGSEFFTAGNNIKKDITSKTPITDIVEREHKALEELRARAFPEESTVGAAANTGAKEDIRPGTTLNPEIQQGDVPMGAFEGKRVSVVGQGATSEDPTERLLIPHLGEDAVGKPKGQGTTPISTSEFARLHFSRNEASWYQAVKPNYDKWAERQGFSRMRRKFVREEDWEKFSKQVYDYVEDTRPDAKNFYDPEVVSVGERQRSILKRYAEEFANPGLEDGTTMRSIAGAENLKPDANYVPKIADREAIDDLTARYGHAQISRMVREAVKDEMAREGYDIKEELLTKVADGWLTNISKAGYGDADSLADIFSGRSRSRMHEVLGAAGIDEDTVKQIVEAMQVKDAKTPRLKHRSPINYRYSTKLRDLKTGETKDVSVLDMFSKDMNHIMMSYSRRASGEIAMARLRIKDPTQQNSPDYWIDGITSKAEFDAKIKKAIEDSYFRRGADRAAAQTALKRAEFLYNATLGLPQHHLNPTLTKSLRRVRDYNFLRLMNNMGITQAIEVGRVFSMTGVRAALSNMPSLKRIVQQGGETVELNNKMARELEMWGVTENDYWIGAAKYRFQEELAGETPGGAPSRLSKLGQQYDDVINKGKEVLANTSLQRPIHSRQQQWAARAATQWFADNARDAKKFAKYQHRLADMGLTKADMDKIATQITAHAEAPDPSMRKITAMNFDKWDPEVRAKFLASLRRYTNRIVQVNEVGNLPMFFSHPIAQTFLQFRTFSVASYDKATLWNLKHRDQQAMMIAVGDITFGAATFALLAHVRAMNRDDRDEYLEEQLSLKNLATMGFARAGISSIVPMLVDSGLAFTPTGPMFMGARSSGTATDALGGSAPFDLLNGVASTSGAIMDSVWNDRELSQQELRGGQRITPFGNHLAPVSLLNSMITDRDLMAPRKEQ
jgi:hypothetical protein